MAKGNKVIVAKGKKSITGYIKLRIKAGGAMPSPPVGPALGQRGLNIMDFCKKFNEHTKSMEQGMLIPVIISVYSDKSFTFVTKSPPASVLLLKAAGISKGSSNPLLRKVARVSMDQIRKIAEIKHQDLNAASVDAAMRMIIGSAKSMGIEVF